MTYRFTSAALTELKQAAMAYERKEPGLGARFLSEIDSTGGRILMAPIVLSNPPLLGEAFSVRVALSYSDTSFFLVGVFLDDSAPTGAAPPSLDFRSGGLGPDFPSLSPLIGQTFYIGDGRTGQGRTGTPQTIAVPPTATRLFLGIADGQFDGSRIFGQPGSYIDNSGSFEVTMQFNAACPSVTIQVSTVDICWSSETNKLYQVHYRSDLTTNKWVDFGAPVPGTGKNLCVTDSVRGQPKKFYRIECLSEYSVR